MSKIKTILILFIMFSSIAPSIAQNNVTVDTTFANTIFAKATKFDSTANNDSAFFYYTKASELFLKLASRKDLPPNWGSIKFLVTLRKLELNLIKVKNYVAADATIDIMIDHAKFVFGDNNQYTDYAYNDKGWVYYYIGLYDKTVEYWLKAIQIEKVGYGEKSPSVLQSYNMLGELYNHIGNYDLALEYYLKVLEIEKEFLSENNTYIATSYNDIGRTYSNKGEFDLALEYHLKSLNIKKNLFGEKHPDVATSYCNIGQVYYKKGGYDLALEFLLKSCNIIKETGNENSLLIATIYNDIGVVYSTKGENTLALEYTLSALNIRQKLLGEKHADIASSYNSIGTFYFNTANYDLALEYFFKALNIYKELYGEIHPGIATSYNNIGGAYLRKGEGDLALEYHLKTLEVQKNIYGEKHSDIAVSYSNIAAVYINKASYDLALEYLLQALSINIELLGENHPNTATCYNNIGIVYNSKGEYDLALEYYIKSLKILRGALGDNHPNVAMTYNNIGDIYGQKSEYDLALEYYFKALNVKKELLKVLDPDLAMFYTNIGLVYSYKGKYDLALELYLKALKIKKDFFGEKHPDVAWSYNIIGTDFNKQKKYELALKYFQKGIVANSRNFNDSSNVYSNPIFRNYFEAPAMLISLYGKAQAFSRNEDFKSSLRNFNLCDSLIFEMRKTASSKTDKFTFGEQTQKIYEEAINATILLAKNPPNNYPKEFYEERALNYSEKSKAGVLINALTGQESLKFAGIPDSLLKKEHELKVNISFYEKKLAEAPDSTNEIIFRDQLFKLNRKYDELIAKFEKDYPDYFNLKYATKDITIKDIQILLNDKTAIRSYFQGDSIIYIFTLTKNTLDVQEVPKLANLNDTINWFRYGLTKTSPRMQESYRRIGFLMYQQLFPESAPIDSQIENLIIIPDGNLAILPFESLLTSNYIGDINSNKEYPFLIKKYNISYSYSANLFYRTFSKEASSTIEMTKLNDWLAYAPVFNNISDQIMIMSTRELQKQLKWLKTDSLMINRSMFDRSYITPLPATETETEAIFKLYDNNDLKARVLLHNNANEKSIKSGELEQYKVLHFATHGFVNSERPELSGLLLAQDTSGGEDGVLYSGEIYNLKLNADLVVLSACETGLGKIQKGEGIIGLTRALLYAGAKNIIVSLWQVADESTSDLMVDFYKNSLASKGQLSYSEALRNAKLKMISEGKYAHPLFWSPFILIGK